MSRGTTPNPPQPPQPPVNRQTAVKTLPSRILRNADVNEYFFEDNFRRKENLRCLFSAESNSGEL